MNDEDQGRVSGHDQPDEPTLPLSSGRPAEPPTQWSDDQPGRQPGATSWMPPTSQAPPHQWGGFPGPATQQLPAQDAQRPGQRPGESPAPRGRVPGWTWPLVALLALVLGVAGGLGGSLLYDRVIDPREPGTVSGGLDGVDTVSTPPLPEENGSVAAVAQALLPSTVQISAELDGQQGGATGSGFVLDRQGHVITNNHVVEDAASSEGTIEIVDQDGNRYDATVVGRSPVYDLAVLYAKGARKLKPASLGASQELRVGAGVVAFGSPLGLSSTVTAGIVSALDRPVTTGDSGSDSSYINAVQTDAAINPGNSGGPLVDLEGRVVGVNSAIATTGGGLGGESGNIGVGFAIPIEQVRTTADQILRTGEARYPVIGAQVATGRDDGRGATIDEVLEDTPAEESGLRKGDVITEVNGERVTDGIALIVAIRSHQPGETLEFTVRRGGAERTISVTLDSEVG